MGGVLDIEEVSKAFGGNVVLDEVSLRADAGAVTALIGPNGAGKSTLANIVSGFIPATRGRVLLDGDDLLAQTIRQRVTRGVGRTFQNLEVFVGMSVVENVMTGTYATGRTGYPAALLGTRRVAREERHMHDRAMSLLADWGLAGVADRRVEELSFGEAKLVELARVLAMEPEIIVMDEPAAGLPPSAAHDVGGRIKHLSEEGITILLIEHNMQVVMGVADTIVVLDQGTVIATGPPETVRTDQRVIEAYLGRAGAAAQAMRSSDDRTIEVPHD